jgi:hypothetical protein
VVCWIALSWFVDCFSITFGPLLIFGLDRLAALPCGDRVRIVLGSFFNECWIVVC